MALDVEWERLTAPEIRAVAARPGALAVLPIGALEQHGPHLPVNTDTLTASAAAIRAAQCVADELPVLVLPGIWTGLSENHLPFGGTISLTFAELFTLLSGITRSLRALGFARLMIVNGHGGNVDGLAVAARELAHLHGLPVVAATPWVLTAKRAAEIAESAEVPGHACEGEASIMLAIAPELVRADQFDAAMQQRPEPTPAFRGFSRFWSYAERAPVTGVRGDPRRATAAKGEAFLKLHVEALAEGMLTRPCGAGPIRSGRRAAAWDPPTPPLIDRSGRLFKYHSFM